MMHCTIWTEGVREIVSAEDSDVKFIISDHPVTIYNHAAPPDSSMCAPERQRDGAAMHPLSSRLHWLLMPSRMRLTAMESCWMPLLGAEQL